MTTRQCGAAVTESYGAGMDRTTVDDRAGTSCRVSVPDGQRTRMSRGGLFSLQPKKDAAEDCE
jgi:hypothetical protein